MLNVKTLAVGQLKELSKEGEGLAIIATLNVKDKDGDVTVPGAFGEQEAKMVPTHDWSHVPLGKARVYEEGTNVYASFKMNLEIPSAKEWHSALKFDLDNGAPLQEWSYGFMIGEASYGDFEGEQVRFLKQLVVHEISPVMLGAGNGTRTVAVKSLKDTPMQLAEHIKAAIENVQSAIERCEDVKAVRELNGRDLSPDRYKELQQLLDVLKGWEDLKERITVLLAKQVKKENTLSNEAARELYSRLVATDIRVSNFLSE